MNQMTQPLRSDPRRALVLQGGGALGAYQAGVYEALTKSGFRPDWLAGVSIGAINASIIAGNSPDRRMPALRAFWEMVSSSLPIQLPFGDEQTRAFISNASASWVTAFGVAGFFRPRIPPPFLMPQGSDGAISYYDTGPLKSTLEQLVDFERINSKETRLSLGAVNVQTGVLHYFDNMNQEIGPEHVMASGALPPGFPPIEIDGQYFWDGGVVSNTPLEYVLDETLREDLLVFQVDLFNRQGPLPRTMLDVMERMKDIHYASRTVHNTRCSLEAHEARMALRGLLLALPEELRNDPNAKLLEKLADDRTITVAQFVYRNKPYEGSSKDYEFSRMAMLEHWQAGISDVEHCMRQHEPVLHQRPQASATRVLETQVRESVVA